MCGCLLSRRQCDILMPSWLPPPPRMKYGDLLKKKKSNQTRGFSLSIFRKQCPGAIFHFPPLFFRARQLNLFPRLFSPTSFIYAGESAVLNLKLFLFSLSKVPAQLAPEPHRRAQDRRWVIPLPGKTFVASAPI